MLAIHGLNQFYGGSHILWDVNLEVPEGSCTCLMGRNGMGKTTLLKCIMGLLPIASGAMSYGSAPRVPICRARGRPARAAGHRLRAAGSRDLFAAHGGRKSAHRLRLAARQEDRARCRSTSSRCFRCSRRCCRRRGGDLSGGQQQQLAIGRALVLDPKLLILDEPAEGIQPNIVHEIGDIIMRLNREAKLTVLLVEQKLPFARRVASEFRIIDKGRIVGGGEIAALTDDLVHQHLTV